MILYTALTLMPVSLSRAAGELGRWAGGLSRVGDAGQGNFVHRLDKTLYPTIAMSRIMQNSEDFHTAYQQLEKQMKKLAEAEGDIFLPNPIPHGPVDYVLICMEPSIGRWAENPEDARAKVAAGFRNFLFSIEDFILHYCVRHYLCGVGEQYHITDLSKGAMLVERANHARSQRYDRWYHLLQQELDLVTTASSGIIAVGNVVARHLERRGFSRPFTKIIHYSPQAARARKDGIVGLEDEFQSFKDSVSLQDVIDTARNVLREAGIPARFRDRTLSRLARRQLTASRQRLIFNYKIAFESL